MKKTITIVQFEPIVGGESVLCNNLAFILKEHYKINIVHPYLDRIQDMWKTSRSGKFINFSELANEVNSTDFSIFVNSTHIKNSRNLHELALQYQKIDGKKLVFYEHGIHTYEQCNYQKVFEILQTKNTVKVLTNTEEGKKKYNEIGIDSFLCRQPFISSAYREIKSNLSEVPNICFNSRFSASKLVDKSIMYFSEFLDDTNMNFSLNYRHSGFEQFEGVDIYKNVVKTSRNASLKKYSDDIGDVYDHQDFCLYFGYDDQNELGKIEYSLLEAFYYEIPVISHPRWLRKFKHEEYGVDKDYISKCLISLDPHTFKEIIRMPKENFISYTENCKLLLGNFDSKSILSRVDTCLNSF